MNVGIASALALPWARAAKGAACGVSGTAQPIHEQAYVPIGGIDQWIEIAGADHHNPTILVLHGGPGSTWDPLTGVFADWEKHFTMVYWSQRGAGKTYRKTGPSIASTMTIDRMVDDGIEVAEFFRRHLDKDKIILLGHSWGTVLGITMVQKRPAQFSAYVGTGQLVNVLKDERTGHQTVLQRARLAGRLDAVSELETLGEPPYDDINKMVVERKWADIFDTPSDAAFNAKWKNPASFTESDNKERIQAWLFSNLIMWGQKRQDGPLMAVDFTTSAITFQIPMIFIQGGDDHITPIALVEDYVRQITAPRKVLVRLPGGGHNAVFSMQHEFLNEVIRELGTIAC